jgi:hypothetical protein
MRIAIVKRYIKDQIKKAITKRYVISFDNLFTKKTRYYLIRRTTPWAGFYANYLYVAGHIVYALRKGYIPVIDMENYRTLYNEDGMFMGTKNSWEYYFQQPYGKTVEEAMRSHNYILSDFSTMREYIPYRDGKSFFEIDWEKAASLVNVMQKFMTPNKDILNDVDLFVKSHFIGKKVLGVHYRGTDKKVCVKNHFLSASLKNYITQVERCIKEESPDLILLCTDDKEAISVFTEKYSGKVVFSNAFRAEEGDTEGIHLKKGETRKNHNYLLGREVIIDAMLLVQCNYFIFSHSNVTTAVMFLNNQKFNKVYFVED